MTDQNHHRETAQRLMQAADHHMEAAHHLDAGNSLASSISTVMAQGCLSLAIDKQINNKDNFLKVVIL